MNCIKDKFVATFLGGSKWDVLGYLVEFMSLENIKSIYGNKGMAV